MITLIKAEIVDLEFIYTLELNIENSNYIIAYEKNRHIDNINSGVYEYLLIKHGENSVGYIINKIDHLNKILEIVRIVVDQKGHGYGKMALLMVIKTYLEKRYNKIWLDVFSDNSAAKALYHKVGFIKSGQSSINGRQLDILVYQDNKMSAQQADAPEPLTRPGDP